MTREEAIDRLMWLKGVPHINDDKWIEAVDIAIEALQFAQHFDLLKEHESLQEVVRCKDCVWSKEWNDKQIFCDRILMRLRETDFCSYGERREE